MKTTFHLTAIAALLGVSSMTHAALSTNSGAVGFNGTGTVTASGTNVTSATSNNNGASVANVAVGQFDASVGVLTGVELQLNSSRTQTINGVGNKNNGPGRTANGSGTSTAALTASGASLTIAPAITQAGTGCSLAQGPTGAINCAWGPNTAAATATNGSASVNSNDLDSYVGSGTVNAELTLPNLSATTTLSSIGGQAGSGTSTTYQVTWGGTLQASYSYLLHADASFDGDVDQNTLTLDFGTVQQGSTVSPLAFSIFNLADSQRAGLDLDSVLSSGDVSVLTTDLAGFASLAQGGSNGFNAFLDTTNAGVFAVQYILNLSDEDIGASTSRLGQQLTLNLVGNVTAVPLPASVWLFGAAMMTALGIGRRKQVI